MDLAAQLEALTARVAEARRQAQEAIALLDWVPDTEEVDE